jgi:hypothetical protein
MRSNDPAVDDDLKRSVEVDDDTDVDLRAEKNKVRTTAAQN